MIPEAIVRGAIASPLTLIASDGVQGHPRSSGTFARVMGRYVRQVEACSWRAACIGPSSAPRIIPHIA